MRSVIIFFIILNCSIGLFADGIQPEGSGTEEDPYQIEILDNLLWISTNYYSWDKHFIQTNDIDASNTQNWNYGNGLNPIGTDYVTNFTGSYNGRGHIVDELYIDDNTNTGLFGYLSGATIDSLGVTNAHINGSWYVGALAGKAFDSTISNCFSTGYVEATNYGGGLVGENGSEIINCYSTASIEVDSNVGGGLVGYNRSNINKCYSIGVVNGSSNIGGLIGVAYGTSNVENSFWDIETSGQINSSGGTGKTTVEMKDVATYTYLATIGLTSAWDFVGNPFDDIGNEDYWNIDEDYNNGYPGLNWEFFKSNFVASSTSVNPGSNAQFTDLSTGNPSNWEWDFDNDGTVDSNEQNPQWQYNESGFYSVSLTISNDINTDTLTKYNYIVVMSQPPGLGTEMDPYQISTLANLLWISQTKSSWDKDFIQIIDIDASITQNWDDGNGGIQEGFFPIGNNSDKFTGSYNGQNNVIDELYINRENAVGFFGIIQESQIENIGITNCNIDGYFYIGSLVGYNISSTISDCYASGFVSGHWYVGGLVGQNYDNSIVNNCNAYCSVNGDSEAGGLIGRNYNSYLTNSHSSNIVIGESKVGGLVGLNWNSTISNCYSNCNLDGNAFVGGIVGSYDNAIINNSHYNYDEVLINGENIITVGALFNEQFNTWVTNNFSLNINNYLANNGENYIISDENDLKQLLAFGQSNEYSYILTNDIDLENESNFYIPYFAGEFSGNDCIISNLSISLDTFSNVGLFGYTHNALIHNIGLINVDITGDWFIGGLVGQNDANSLISDCFTTSSINGR